MTLECGKKQHFQLSQAFFQNSVFRQLRVLHFKICSYPDKRSEFACEIEDIGKKARSRCSKLDTIALELPKTAESSSYARSALEYLVAGLEQQPISIILENFGLSELGEVDPVKRLVVSLHAKLYDLSGRNAKRLASILCRLPKLEKLFLDVSDDLSPDILGRALKNRQAKRLKSVTISGWSRGIDDLKPLLIGVVAKARINIENRERLKRKELAGPQTLSPQAIVHDLENPGRKSYVRKPKNLIVFTDVERDIDDAVLLVILAYLHKTEVAKVLLVVANVKPSESRAKAAKVIFENGGAPDVPVAYGTEGTDEELDLHDHELKDIEEPIGEILDAKIALVDVLKNLKGRGEKCDMIVVSSHRDLSKLIKDHETLVKDTVSSVFFQGAWETNHKSRQVKTLIPDMSVINYDYDSDATKDVHKWLREGTIPTYTATRHSAFNAPISSRVFREAGDSGNSVARRIYHAFGEQERKYYNQAAEKDPTKRFRPHLDKRWYTNRTDWPKYHGDTLPDSFEDVQPYIRMTLYDVVAGLISPLLEYTFLEQFYQPHRQKILVGRKKVSHYIIGRCFEDKTKQMLPDVNPEALTGLILELLQRALFT